VSTLAVLLPMVVIAALLAFSPESPIEISDMVQTL
jgi:hypothetical protein